jgi:hypothetical protein
MNGQIIDLSKRDAGRRHEIHRRLEYVISVFEQIESEELLAALPECPLARRNHLTALDLFAEVEVELRRLVAEAQGLPVNYGEA